MSSRQRLGLSRGAGVLGPITKPPGPFVSRLPRQGVKFNRCPMKNTDQKKAFYIRSVERGIARVAKRCPWCGKLHQVEIPLDDVDMEYVKQMPCGKCDDPAVFGN